MGGRTMVWHRSRPCTPYWEWVACAQHAVLTITPTLRRSRESSSGPRQLPVQVPHPAAPNPQVPGAPSWRRPLHSTACARGPAVGARPGSPDPPTGALRGTRKAPTAAAMYLQPRTEPGIWFHDLPLLATIRGAIVATDAGTTLAGMTMVLAHEREYTTKITSGIGTSQEGEALTLLLCVHRLEAQQGTYRVVLDSESAVGALRTYEEGGKCGDGMHHLYAHSLGAERPSPRVRDQRGGDPLPLDHLHQRPGGRGYQGGATSGSHVAATAPVRLPPPGTVAGPLPASSEGPARVVAGADTGALRAPVGAQLPAGYGSALGLVHQRPADAHRGPPHTQSARCWRSACCAAMCSRMNSA